jgi:RNA polymerase sigma-70 factor, ECF subfamily
MRSEQELVRGIKKRDPGLFEEFVRLFQQRVFFTALRMLGERDEALDASQEVFLKVWRFGSKLSDSIPLERWIYRVTVNACIDRLRSLRIHEKKQTRNNLVVFSIAEPGMNPRDFAKRLEELDQVKEALNELTDRQRAVFVLRHFQNLKMQEISEILSMPLGTVKATLHQTFCKLKGLLQLAPGRSIDAAPETCCQTG